MIDYHMHCCFSMDSEARPEDMIEAAQKRGLNEICFTDHVDYDRDGDSSRLPDLAARKTYFDGIRDRYPDVAVKLGAEISLKDELCTARSLEFVRASNPDFIIASLHLVNGVGAWEKGYYDMGSREEVYRAYIDGIADMLPSCRGFNVLGHYDFCAKYAPYENRGMTLADGADTFDRIFRLLAQNGRGMEINTAAWKQDPAWGLDILKRFVELGGEYVTFGSDAHRAENVGARAGEAYELACAAGVPYYATFNALVPTLHRLG